MSFLQDAVFLLKALSAIDQEPHPDGLHGEQGHAGTAHLNDTAITFQKQEFPAGCVGQVKDAADARRLFIDVADFTGRARPHLDLYLSWIKASPQRSASY